MDHLADITIQQSAAVLTFAKTFEGAPYQSGAGQNSNPTSGFDCSGFIWYVLTQQGFNYPYTPTSAMANSQSLRQLNIPPEVINAGDLILFNGHAGFFDPNPPIPGKTLYSATTTGGVHNEDPTYFGPIVGYYRLQV